MPSSMFLKLGHFRTGMGEPWPFVWKGTSSLLHDTFHFLFSCARWGVCWWHLSNYIAQKSPSQAEVWPWKQGRPLRWWSWCSRIRVDNILAMPPEVDGRCCAVKPWPVDWIDSAAVRFPMSQQYCEGRKRMLDRSGFLVMGCLFTCHFP